MSEELNVKGSKVIGGMFESGRDEVAIPHSGETIPWRDVVAFVIQRVLRHLDSAGMQSSVHAPGIRLATAPKSSNHVEEGTGLHLPPVSEQDCCAAAKGLFMHCCQRQARLKLRIRWRSDNTSSRPLLISSSG